MITFKHDEDGSKGKFTILEDNQPAGQMTYVWVGAEKFIIDHTETFEGFNGKGYGKLLVLQGIEYAKEKNVKIIPLCPYAKRVMKKDQSLHDMIFK